MPSASFEHSVSISEPVDVVWAALMRPGTWENIGPVEKVWDPTHEGDVLTGYAWSTQVGAKTFQGTATLVDHEKPDRYVIDLDAGEMAGRIGIDLTAANPATDMHVTLEFRTKGLLSSMFFPVIRDAIASGFPQQIEDFAASLQG